MKFLVCKKQEGAGCDYTIGCGMLFNFVEADSLEDALESIIWPEGRDEGLSSLEGDYALRDIYIIPEESVHIVDVSSIKAKIIEDREKTESDEHEAKERELLAKLEAKYSS